MSGGERVCYSNIGNVYMLTVMPQISEMTLKEKGRKLQQQKLNWVKLSSISLQS